MFNLKQPPGTENDLAFATSIESGQLVQPVQFDQVLYCWLTNFKFSS